VILEGEDRKRMARTVATLLLSQIVMAEKLQRLDIDAQAIRFWIDAIENAKWALTQLGELMPGDSLEVACERVMTAQGGAT
jgi:hypothetical protein